jgi:hypothetical protein
MPIEKAAMMLHLPLLGKSPLQPPQGLRLYPEASYQDFFHLVLEAVKGRIPPHAAKNCQTIHHRQQMIAQFLDPHVERDVHKPQGSVKLRLTIYLKRQSATKMLIT